MTDPDYNDYAARIERMFEAAKQKVLAAARSGVHINISQHRGCDPVTNGYGTVVDFVPDTGTVFVFQIGRGYEVEVRFKGEKP